MPEPIIDQYRVNVPHQFFKVYGLGDVYSPKEASLTVEQRYQNVRIVARLRHRPGADAADGAQELATAAVGKEIT